MAKKKMEKPRREVTRRQITSWEKAKKKQRTILIGGIVIIVAALSTVSVGWLQNSYIPLHQTVIIVNDRQFNMDYYIKMLKFYSQGQVDYLPSLADAAAQAIEQNELMKEEAAQLGITASSAEIDKQLDTSKVGKDYRDIAETQVLRDKLLKDYFLPKIPESGEQRHVLAMFLESEKQANEIRAKLVSGEDFATLADQYTLDSRTKEQKGDFGWHPKDILGKIYGEKVVDDRAFSSEPGIFSPPVADPDKTKQIGYWLVKVEDKKGDRVEEAHVLGMLLGSAEEADTVRARLAAGEDLVTVAKEVSQDPATKSSGDVGALTRGQKPALDTFVFDPTGAIGTISQPIPDKTVTTQGGHWLIKVAAVENDRKIDDSDRQALSSAAFNEWFGGLLPNAAGQVQTLLSSEQKQFAISRATRELTPIKARGTRQ